MTTADKRKLLEVMDICVNGDLFTDMEFRQILGMCYAVIYRADRENIEIARLTRGELLS